MQSQAKGKENTSDQQLELNAQLQEQERTFWYLGNSTVPNSVLATEPDVCLIVPDLQRGRKRDTTFAKFVEQYEEMLLENGTKNIKQART